MAREQVATARVLETAKLMATKTPQKAWVSDLAAPQQVVQAPHPVPAVAVALQEHAVAAVVVGEAALAGQQVDQVATVAVEAVAKVISFGSAARLCRHSTAVLRQS